MIAALRMASLVETMRQFVQSSLPPSQVAEMVFEAIHQEKFYILTHPTTTKQGVQLRMEDILQERMSARSLNELHHKVVTDPLIFDPNGCSFRIFSERREGKRYKLAISRKEPPFSLQLLDVHQAALLFR